MQGRGRARRQRVADVRRPSRSQVERGLLRRLRAVEERRDPREAAVARLDVAQRPPLEVDHVGADDRLELELGADADDGGVGARRIVHECVKRQPRGALLVQEQRAGGDPPHHDVEVAMDQHQPAGRVTGSRVEHRQVLREHPYGPRVATHHRPQRAGPEVGPDGVGHRPWLQLAARCVRERPTGRAVELGRAEAPEVGDVIGHDHLGDEVARAAAQREARGLSPGEIVAAFVTGVGAGRGMAELVVVVVPRRVDPMEQLLADASPVVRCDAGGQRAEVEALDAVDGLIGRRVRVDGDLEHPGHRRKRDDPDGSF